MSQNQMAPHLPFRLRCSRCRAFNGFEIIVKDVRNTGDNSKPCPEPVIVAPKTANFYRTSPSGR